MIEIKDLLSRFNNILLGGEAKRELVRETITSVTKIEISPDKIEIKNNIIYLDLKPIHKNEIFLKKDQIFSKLKEALGGKAPEGVR